MEPSNLRIAIIGGGPGGLSAAISLFRKGFKNVTVFERDQNTEARKQGYSFSLFAPKGGLQFLKDHGLFEEVEPHSCTSGMRIMDGDSGKVMMEMSKMLWTDAPGADARRIIRVGLRNALVGVCQREGILIKWGSKYLSYEESDNAVTLKFENEKPFEADLLIAADGLHSKVRDQLIGDPILYTGYTAIFGMLFPKDNSEIFEHPLVKGSGAMFSGANRAFFMMNHHTKHNNELYWTLSIASPEGEIRKKTEENPTKLKQLALETLEGWKLPTNIVSSTAESGIHPVLEYRDKEPLKVDPKSGRACNSKSKRITLLGDAAHPMLPFAAAGCNNALLDVEKITQQLAALLSLEQITTQDIDNALSGYEKEMIARTTEACLASRHSAKSNHEASAFGRYKRYLILRAFNFKLNLYSPHKALFNAVAMGLAVLFLAWLVSRFI